MTEARRFPHPRRRKGAYVYALASVLCGLIYPVTVLIILIGQLVQSGDSPGNPLLAAFTTVFLYFEWPAAILALSFGRAARARANPERRLAMVGLALGYLSAAMILAAVAWVLVAASR